MDARHAERIELATNVVAAGALAAASAYSALRLGAPPIVAVPAAAVVMLAALRLLSAIEPAPRAFAVAPFDVPPLLQPAERDELLLTEADRLQPVPQAPAGEEELVLDDVLASLGEQSRVVRLFDPAAMPGPAELKSRIDRHLDGSEPPLLSPDASKALHDALSELRRSLR